MSRPSILITGAAAGIGRATAQRFAAQGWRVGLYDIDERGVAELAAALGGESVSGALDVTDAEAFAAAVAGFCGEGALDVLFNNAGILSVGDFETIPPARHHALVDVNLKGVINGCAAALPYLRRRPGSCVVNMASASAIHGAPAYASYSATKFAVKGLTEALDIEWARHGVRVMDILPLFVDTAMVTAIEQPASIARMGVHLQPQDIAEVVWQAAQPRRRRRVHWYPGAQGRALALAHKLLPASVYRLLVRHYSGY